MSKKEIIAGCYHLDTGFHLGINFHLDDLIKEAKLRDDLFREDAKKYNYLFYSHELAIKNIIKSEKDVSDIVNELIDYACDEGFIYEQA
tara:strand:- start:1193 stop:1459 length:267 start_codon:yes stop_codon:yes gene_type:complete